MLQNKLLYYVPMLYNHIFKIKETFVCEYFLTSKFKLFVIINNYYNKFDYLNARKFNKYILKSFSIHWTRVAFKGKGFRLRKFKNVNKVTLNFGHSH